MLSLGPKVESFHEQGMEEKFYAHEVESKVVQTDQKEVEVLLVVSL